MRIRETREARPNIWLGVSVCGPDDLHRVTDLMATPAAHRWVSWEPATAPIDWAPFCGIQHEDALGIRNPEEREDPCPGLPMHDPWCRGIECLVMGCQKPFPKDSPKCSDCSGTGWGLDVNENEGPCFWCRGTGYAFYSWARAARDACERAGVAFALKQGPDERGRVAEHPALDGEVYNRYPWLEDNTNA